jgi:hypothetical protein
MEKLKERGGVALSSVSLGKISTRSVSVTPSAKVGLNLTEPREEALAVGRKRNSMLLREISNMS